MLVGELLCLGELVRPDSGITCHIGFQLMENHLVLFRDIFPMIIEALLQRWCQIVDEVPLSITADLRMDIEQQLQPGRSRSDRAADEKNLLVAQRRNRSMQPIERES